MCFIDKLVTVLSTTASAGTRYSDSTDSGNSTAILNSTNDGHLSSNGGAASHWQITSDCRVSSASTAISYTAAGV